MTATNPREGGPLKTTPQPHGRYRVKSPEGQNEEQVVEVVRNGVSGTTADTCKFGVGGLACLMR